MIPVRSMKLVRHKTHSPTSETHRRVQLEYVNPNARAVFVAGTFNEWRSDATEMVAMGAGRWWKELMLTPGEHQYRLVVDGTWVDDPVAKEYVPNPLGGRNAIIRVAPFA